MDLSDLKSNSHKSREVAAAENKRERRATKVVTGSAKTRKNEKRKLANIFISEDASNVKSYVFMDVLVPAIKKAISDIVTNGVDMILYGETRSNRSNGRSSSNVSYRSYYNDSRDRRDSRDSRIRFDYDDVTFETRRDAIAVRDEMQNISREYGFVRVADLYDLADISAPYTAVNYGWFDVSHVDIMQLRDGRWILKLPKAMPIER